MELVLPIRKLNSIETSFTEYKNLHFLILLATASYSIIINLWIPCININITKI